MKKTNKLMLSLFIATAPFTHSAFAEAVGENVADQNKAASELRNKIDHKKLENDFYNEELTILQKRRSIEKIKQELNDMGTMNSGFSAKNLDAPTEEDVLVNGLEDQNVGFVYETDIEQLKMEAEDAQSQVLSEEEIQSRIDNVVSQIMSEKEKDFEAKKIELEQRIQQITEQQHKVQQQETFENVEENVLKEITVNNFMQIGKTKKVGLKFMIVKHLNGSEAGHDFEEKIVDEGEVFDLLDNKYKVVSITKGKVKILNISEDNELVVKF